ncbi:hypothetical protein SGRA_2549 [Saprospira grandis str. Lewin]|uniref:Uncharacterized protein n=1 Tax=Saprospira grandis (strain Lewin) TaxID=984262 RepID=H6L6N1_SAPGL|nr:hypothetical protein SGRA_2549 [Saprospira grandis str. Lewin]
MANPNFCAKIVFYQARPKAFAFGARLSSLSSARPKGPFFWPSDVEGGGAAADQGRQAAGPSEQRAPQRSAEERSEAEAPKEREKNSKALKVCILHIKA